MKSTLVIARRELTEKRFVVLTAIAFAMLALIVPFVPGVHSGERRTAIAMAFFWPTSTTNLLPLVTPVPPVDGIEEIPGILATGPGGVRPRFRAFLRKADAH